MENKSKMKERMNSFFKAVGETVWAVTTNLVASGATLT